MKKTLLTATILFTCASAMAGKSCDELKTEVAAKLESHGVKSYTLEAVPNDKVGDGKVVGSCDGGTKKLMYTRK